MKMRNSTGPVVLILFSPGLSVIPFFYGFTPVTPVTYQCLWFRQKTMGPVLDPVPGPLNPHKPCSSTVIAVVVQKPAVWCRKFSAGRTITVTLHPRGILEPACYPCSEKRG
jgi:hypothetical protein